MKYSFFQWSLELECPACRSALNDKACLNCSFVYAEKNGVPALANSDFLAGASVEEQSDAENKFKNFFKRWPTFYRWCVRLIAPVIFTGLTAKDFLKRFNNDQLLLNVGSGPTRIHPRILNVDLFPFENVNIIAQAEKLPFQKNTFDAVCTEEVLEHLPHPEKATAELMRVTKPGGYIYVSVPFIFPYHPSPKDYTRFTRDGLMRLFDGCEISEAGIMCGPVSGTLVVLANGLAVIFSFGIVPVQKILNYLFMTVLSPLKLLDLIYAKLPGAEMVAAGIYIIVKKKTE